ncbi:O-glucosyltransferase rumi [Brachypodium distachyon]|uniref:Glycosyl transferase CAP10 domain-containing protein n=1 Tax=Brachypodium distachyon TaxID=15368 RepID=A0A0Q3FYG2_BRADI|nr:O-glucosyltransferase rumi [Brachypodium distachyon]KQK03373.2 hypothetical protein BRADI_2g07460v3 [Brachypodium distachyon]|eukprot:XP_003565513.2 O-glucosyltransferase rumi [Brachypodium distachyon]
MKSSLPDEEEMAAMVPAAVERQSSPTRTTTKSWWKLGSGVGMIIGSLVLLALLFGTKRIHLDAAYYNNSFLPATDHSTGSSGFSRRGRPPHPRRAHSPLVPIPFTCGNDTSPSSPASLCRRRRRAPSPAPAPSSSQGARRWRFDPSVAPPPWCPVYFRHIHTDLDPWRSTGITRDTLERAMPHAEFRLTVVSGRAYVQNLRPSYQTRDVFTQWGVLQLLARFPGRVPDVDIMFSAGDVAQVLSADYYNTTTHPPPPLFRYCKEEKLEAAIVFPDWSFWGWPELSIRPWAPLMEDFVRENKALPWRNRQPYAFWKGNPEVSDVRRDLFKCNNDSANGKDWNARLFWQDWNAASRNGFRDSNLAKQCDYRYKIYVQGHAWSVSEKYILACDSPMLAVDTSYVDFFSRGLVAGRHYWPIDPARKCRAVKFAVGWGNEHAGQAMRMGQEGSRFAREEMSMDYVYEYMFHVITEYAALLRYRPTVPEKAVEVCVESLACGRRGREKEFLMESREEYEARYEPCTLPPPFTDEEAREMAAWDREVRSKLVKMEEEGH